MKENNIELFELHNHLKVIGSPEEIVEKIVQDIPELEDIGFAGCLEKNWLRTTLKGFMLDKNGNNQQYSLNVEDEENIKKICEDTIKKCEKYINEKIHIFFFPTFDSFVIEKMRGTNGFSTWDKTILVFVNFVDGWKESLKETIVHELAHAVSPFYKGGDFSLGHGLILDGIAEHFRDFVTQGEMSPWTKAISKEESMRIFDELKNKLNKKDWNFYTEVFYGTGKYPLWTGYTLGYYLIEDYLQNKKDFYWNKFLREDPHDILKEILEKE